MAHSRTYEAIVLRTYDIGEADRFCILLTRERGKLAARARGVRKLTSRMGGNILPLCRIKVNLHENGTGFLITGAHAVRSCAACSVEEFLQAQQGIELLMQLLEDDDPLPELFDLTEEFLEACSRESSPAILPFSIRLLFLLGLLPRVPTTALPEADAQQIHTYMKRCTTKEWLLQDDLSIRSDQCIRNACNAIIAQHARSELRVAAVAGSIARAGKTA
ncbi:MAG: DNA repair protein RecO [Candidatus Peribacteraceae bacterium]|nr:DNA repair protein RecO [Candidatus Peribacteraceae bacterium]